MITVLQVARLPNIKVPVLLLFKYCIAWLSYNVNMSQVATVLLCCAFLYDIFWVFLSPLIFKDSVMIAVCSNLSSSSLPLLVCLSQFPNYMQAVIKIFWFMIKPSSRWEVKVVIAWGVRLIFWKLWDKPIFLDCTSFCLGSQLSWMHLVSCLVRGFSYVKMDIFSCN